MNFREWLEQAGDATMMVTTKGGYDQCLNNRGLGYRPPIVPEYESKRAKKIEKLFKGKSSDSSKKDENVLTYIDTIAQQISHAPPNLIKQYLQEIIQLLGQDGNEADPHYLHMAATVKQNILPIIAQNPMFRKETDMLQALT